MRDEDKNKKQTNIYFGWMKEGHYSRLLYREEELNPKKGKPKIYVSCKEYPILWDLMVKLEQVDLKIDGVPVVVLRLPYEIIKDNFMVDYNTGGPWCEGAISIFDLNVEQITALIKSKIAEDQAKRK